MTDYIDKLEEVQMLVIKASKIIGEDIQEMKMRELPSLKRIIQDANSLLGSIDTIKTESLITDPMKIVECYNEHAPKWKNKGRTIDSVVIRHCLMYHLRIHCRMSLSEVGEFMAEQAGRLRKFDHTTVMNGLKKLREGLTTGDYFYTRYYALLNPVVLASLNSVK